MGKVQITADKKQAGFTLVELAVVMIIIGLLIGGVLKGQELIANAQIASTVTQAKGIDAAVSTFRDTYNAFPGDMGNATTRIAGCAGNCANSATTNSVLNVAPNAAAANAGEGLQFWLHLSAADLISGVTLTGNAVFGEELPTAPIGGGFVAGYTQTGAIGGQTATANPRSGHYIVLRADAATAASNASAILTPLQAARVDRKMDDGQPNVGTVVAIGTTGATNCASAGAAAGTYSETNAADSCSLAIRIQQ